MLAKSLLFSLKSICEAFDTNKLRKARDNTKLSLFLRIQPAPDDASNLQRYKGARKCSGDYYNVLQKNAGTVCTALHAHSQVRVSRRVRSSVSLVYTREVSGRIALSLSPPHASLGIAGRGEGRNAFLSFALSPHVTAGMERDVGACS